MNHGVMSPHHALLRCLSPAGMFCCSAPPEPLLLLISVTHRTVYIPHISWSFQVCDALYGLYKQRMWSKCPSMSHQQPMQRQTMLCHQAAAAIPAFVTQADSSSAQAGNGNTKLVGTRMSLDGKWCRTLGYNQNCMRTSRATFLESCPNNAKESATPNSGNSPGQHKPGSAVLLLVGNARPRVSSACSC